MRKIWSILLILSPLVALCNPPRYTFTANRGQWPDEVLFRATLPDGALFVERDGFTYLLRAGGDAHHHGLAPVDHQDEPYREHAIRVHFQGGMAQGSTGGSIQTRYENYFLGSDPSHWGTGCPVFGDVVLHGVWPGIDLHLSGVDGLKYELIVAPGADVNNARFRYEGHECLAVVDGALVVGTPAGELVEQAPYSFHPTSTGDVPLASAFKVERDVLSFSFPEGRDPSLALVIDPTLAFASYSGSTGNNFGFTATYDVDGHLYGGGIVFAAGYPTTPGVIDVSYNGLVGANVDVGISKWSADGSDLVWSTYLGGTLSDAPHSMVVNDADELYVFGHTGSSDFPVTAGCADAIFEGGTPLTFTIGYGYNQPAGTDMFVAHLNATATALIGSTYVGGPENDGINNEPSLGHNYGDSFRGEIILDGNGDPVVASTTSSSDLPTPGGAQAIYGGGAQDGYCFRLNPALTAVNWATYIGGADVDAAYGVQVDSANELFVTGGTMSVDLPMTGTPLQGSHAGDADGFIMRYNSVGAWVGSTFLGTSEYDQCYFVQLNTSDEVFVVGQTHGNYPVSPGRYAVAGSSQFIHKIEHDLGTSLWSTVFGNGDPQQDLSPTAFLVSDCGQIYFSGWGGSVNANAGSVTSSTTGLAVSPDAFQSTTDGNDLYLMLLEPDAVALNYATFFGGALSAEHVDGGTSRFDKNGTVYQAVCAGCQNNDDFPTTPGAWSNGNNATGCNLGVIKFDLSIGVASIDIDGDTEVCFPATVQFINNSSGGDTFLWNFGDGSTSTEFEPSHVFASAGEFIVTMEMTDQFGCMVAATDTLVVSSLGPPEAEIEPVDPLCPGGSIQLNGSDAETWSWSPTTGLSDPSVQSPTATPTGPITYQLVITTACGTDSTTVDLSFLDPQGAAGPDQDACLGTGAQLEASGGGTYVWSPAASLSDAGIADPIASPSDTITYHVVITTPDGCVLEDSMIVNIIQAPPQPNLVDTTICIGSSVQLIGPEATTFTWQSVPGIDQLNIRDPIVQPLVPTLFVVEASNGCGTIVDDAFVVVIDPVADAWPDTAVCPGQLVQLGASEGVAYSWTPTSGLDNALIRTPTVAVNAVANYSVTVTDAFGCEASAELTLAILPLPWVEAGPDAVIEFGTSVQLVAQGSGGFEWSPAIGLDDAWSAAPRAKPLSTTTYTVTVTDPNGCRSSDEVTIIVPGSLFIPNTFTPNGDGNNDVFQATGIDIAQLTLFVFDRWGVQIWSTDKLSGQWDGTVDGIDAPIDTYVWKVQAESITGERFDRVGHVNLVR